MNKFRIFVLSFSMIISLGSVAFCMQKPEGEEAVMAADQDAEGDGDVAQLAEALQRVEVEDDALTYLLEKKDAVLRLTHDQDSNRIRNLRQDLIFVERVSKQKALSVTDRKKLASIKRNVEKFLRSIGLEVYKNKKLDGRLLISVLIFCILVNAIIVCCDPSSIFHHVGSSNSTSHGGYGTLGQFSPLDCLFSGGERGCKKN